MIDKYESPMKYKKNIFETLRKQNSTFYDQVIKFLKDKNISNLSIFKKFMTIQVESKGMFDAEKISNFHFAVMEYLRHILP